MWAPFVGSGRRLSRPVKECRWASLSLIVSSTLGQIDIRRGVDIQIPRAVQDGSKGGTIFLQQRFVSFAANNINPEKIQVTK